VLVYPMRESDMVRDLDLIRQLLLTVEGNPDMDGKREFVYQSSEEIAIPDRSLEVLAYHTVLLIEAGYLKGNIRSGYTMPTISRLTNIGHDFLDNIRDPGIWAKTKERAGDLSGAALPVIAGIALAEVKKHFGLP
jgi:Hypothetical protein (DUF2513)